VAAFKQKVPELFSVLLYFSDRLAENSYNRVSQGGVTRDFPTQPETQMFKSFRAQIRDALQTD
jgi:hypothetical protein